MNKLCIVLAIKAVLILALIQYGGIGLGPDEAQYWTWSQSLDAGYYSKPPGIAWQIWLGTQLFGNTELGVRFASGVLGFLLPVAVYHLAMACNLTPSTAFWAGVVMAFTPLGLMASFLAITDVGMVLFWTLACTQIALSLSRKSNPNYTLIGIFILCGALFKWPIYLLWAILIPFIPLYRHLLSWNLLGGIAISLLGLLPAIYWNSSHEWVTFKHVFATVSGGHAKELGATPLHQGNLAGFLGSQVSLLSPILFGLFVLSAIWLWRQRKQISPPLFFCGASCVGILTAFSILSLFQKVQGNWAVFAYPTGIVFLCAYACEKMAAGKSWLKAGVATSVVLSCAIFSIPSIQSHELLPIPYKFNPFRHNVGWNRLPDLLRNAGYDPKQHFLMGDKYQTSSILSFYGPAKKRAYFINLHGIRKNQFSFWPSMAKQEVGKTGFFVLTENMPQLKENLAKQRDFYMSTLKHYFQTVHFLGVSPLFEISGDMAKGALLFKCDGYNGLEPSNPELY